MFPVVWLHAGINACGETSHRFSRRDTPPFPFEPVRGNRCKTPDSRYYNNSLYCCHVGRAGAQPVSAHAVHTRVHAKESIQYMSPLWYVRQHKQISSTPHKHTGKAEVTDLTPLNILVVELNWILTNPDKLKLLNPDINRMMVLVMVLLKCSGGSQKK